MSNPEQFEPNRRPESNLVPATETLRPDQQEKESVGQPARLSNSTNVSNGDPAGNDSPIVEIELVEPVPSGHPIMAWTMILALVLLIVFVPGGEPEAPDPVAGDRIGRKVMEIQGKYLVGAAEMPGVGGAQLFQQAQTLNTGRIDNRLRFVILAGELAGASEAVEQLDHLSKQLERSEIEPTADQEKVMNALSRLYANYQEKQWDPASLDASERELLKRELDWFGRLALSPADGADNDARTAVLAPARRTMIVLLLAFLLGALIAMAGFAALVLFIVLLALGKIGSRLKTGSAGGGLYAETFAVWMSLFLGLNIAVSLIPWEQPTLLLNLAAFSLSLSALAWPVLRGVSWNQVRQDVGLTAGSRPFVEPLWGVVCYISTLPLVVIGLIVIVVMLQLQGFMGEPGGDNFGPVAMPSHPIVQWISKSGWWGRFVIFAIACIAAPLVEETMFRGVLYRHLRNSTAAWRVWLSIVFSVLVNSFLFAAIHPQGYLAIPVLMSLAAGFSLAREWRGSLLAPMTAHATNNALVMIVILMIV